MVATNDAPENPLPDNRGRRRKTVRRRSRFSACSRSQDRTTRRYTKEAPPQEPLHVPLRIGWFVNEELLRSDPAAEQSEPPRDYNGGLFTGHLSAVNAFETARGFHLGRISGSS